jgi:hypothetical protein
VRVRTKDRFIEWAGRGRDQSFCALQDQKRGSSLARPEPGRGREDRPCPSVGTSGAPPAAQDLQLVTKDRDLNVLRSLTRGRAREQPQPATEQHVDDRHPTEPRWNIWLDREANRSFGTPHEGLGPQELRPRRSDPPRRRPQTSTTQHVRDGSGRDRDAELEQLALDPQVAPSGVLPAIRRIRSRTSGSRGGASWPPRLHHCLLTSCRRQRLSVSGQAANADHRSRGKNRLAAARRARSAVL